MLRSLSSIDMKVDPRRCTSEAVVATWPLLISAEKFGTLQEALRSNLRQGYNTLLRRSSRGVVCQLSNFWQNVQEAPNGLGRKVLSELTLNRLSDISHVVSKNAPRRICASQAEILHIYIYICGCVILKFCLQWPWQVSHQHRRGTTIGKRIALGVVVLTAPERRLFIRSDRRHMKGFECV